MDSVGQYLACLSSYELLTAEQEVELAQTMEEGKEAARRLKEDGQRGKERISLERKIRKGNEARYSFLTANLRLVVSNARRIPRPPGVDLLDLIQDGNLGLIRAVEKFEWRRGFKFSTYATWWIRQSINRGIADKARTIRLPAHMHDSFANLRANRTSFLARNGREPTVEELAAAAGIDETRTEMMLSVLHLRDIASLDAPVGENETRVGDLMADEAAVDPEEKAIREGTISELRNAINKLPDREKKVLSLRFGFDSPPLQWEEIENQYGIPAQRARHVTRQALSRLRHPSFGIREMGI